MQLNIEHISFRYTKKSPWVLQDVSLEIKPGERVAIVGPSGYGKSTLAKIIAGYIQPTSGTISTPVACPGTCTYPGKKAANPIQLIGQHPEYAVNPRWKMEKILTECYEPEEELLEHMGIEKEWLRRWPSELSGGELQRFCIARVLHPELKLLICDEITTMLDVITQAQIWQVLLQQSKEKGFGMLVITHNMDLAKQVCERIIDLRELNHIEPAAYDLEK